MPVTHPSHCLVNVQLKRGLELWQGLVEFDECSVASIQRSVVHNTRQIINVKNKQRRTQYGGLRNARKNRKGSRVCIMDRHYLTPVLEIICQPLHRQAVNTEWRKLQLAHWHFRNFHFHLLWLDVRLGDLQRGLGTHTHKFSRRTRGSLQANVPVTFPTWRAVDPSGHQRTQTHLAHWSILSSLLRLVAVSTVPVQMIWVVAAVVTPGSAGTAALAPLLWSHQRQQSQTGSPIAPLHREISLGNGRSTANSLWDFEKLNTPYHCEHVFFGKERTTCGVSWNIALTSAACSFFGWRFVGGFACGKTHGTAPGTSIRLEGVPGLRALKSSWKASSAKWLAHANDLVRKLSGRLSLLIAATHCSAELSS